MKLLFTFGVFMISALIGLVSGVAAVNAGPGEKRNFEMICQPKAFVINLMDNIMKADPMVMGHTMTGYPDEGWDMVATYVYAAAGQQGIVVFHEYEDGQLCLVGASNALKLGSEAAIPSDG